MLGKQIQLTNKYPLQKVLPEKCQPVEAIIKQKNVDPILYECC